MRAWQERATPRDMTRVMLEAGLPLEYHPRLLTCGHLFAMVGREPVGPGLTDLRWHLSISHPARLPDWEELRVARDQLLPPEVCMAIPYPPRAWWVSIHPNCLHLWEIHDPELVDLWRLEGEQAARLGKNRPEPARRTGP